jgi:hypothetical protein
MVELEKMLIGGSLIVKRHDKKDIQQFFDVLEKDKQTPILKDFTDAVPEAAKAASSLALELARSLKDKTNPDNIDLFGIKVVQGTTYQWKNIPAGSRKRDLGLLAKCAILEIFNINSYRKNIVDSSVAHLRDRISKAVAAATEPVHRDGKTLLEWNFSDGLETSTDITEIPQTATTSQGRMAEIYSTQRPNEQIDEIKVIIKAVESSSAAWYDSSGGHHIESNVAETLGLLIKVRLCILHS